MGRYRTKNQDFKNFLYLLFARNVFIYYIGNFAKHADGVLFGKLCQVYFFGFYLRRNLFSYCRTYQVIQQIVFHKKSLQIKKCATEVTHPKNVSLRLSSATNFFWQAHRNDNVEGTLFTKCSPMSLNYLIVKKFVAFIVYHKTCSMSFRVVIQKYLVS